MNALVIKDTTINHRYIKKDATINLVGTRHMNRRVAIDSIVAIMI